MVALKIYILILLVFYISYFVSLPVNSQDTFMDTEIIAAAKFTALKSKIDSLFTIKKIALTDIEDLNNLERDYLAKRATEILKGLTAGERDDFLDKIELIVPAFTKSDIWEHNHFKISSAITKFMCGNGVMPTKNAIAQETGLSRQTVAKHLEAYNTHPEHIAELEQFRFMAPRVLANVFKFAVNGDMKAARLYMEMVGTIKKKQSDTVVNKQNNYIQINNTILSQENLMRLTAEQLNQIENIITNHDYKAL